ncbi:Uncharacterised protein [Mycobacteroides abscessus]|uniref:Apea-like HEPN domain-containing protein n=1 Tax=Mycobacteroides abscessus subsp. massiliense TaxID=1962118 RepID=A0AB38DI82_9MYCO|nr:hypothetical protein [Mycobacteroides abscessus]MBN7341741.1 hypothetical protein [Mycobacteroides abscessus subsp. massiliense]MBN7537908.1 hypothetical protein [Mycobacteroides abscessus subsp. massiliense]MDB2307014.1 hypothetical protein [Mycobacteroides abscessus subsp. massiliense]MDO2974847.1 hypothetical protein [Mycobacteroides abscessus subsp. massiliense]MDO3357567.1 hypothetical protein [Mycobacteroides abscessus subsp. massiliense]
MTIPTGEDDDIHLSVLRFLGAFSHLQDLIDDVLARSFFERRMPKTADLIWQRAVSRINDRERIELFLNISEDLGTDAELESVQTIYMRVKELRDRVAHSTQFTTTGGDRLAIGKTVLSSLKKLPPAPLEVDRVTIYNAVWECRWIEAQILYVLVGNQRLGMGSPHSPTFEILKPAGTPEQWSGITHRPAPD